MYEWIANEYRTKKYEISHISYDYQSRIITVRCYTAVGYGHIDIDNEELRWYEDNYDYYPHFRMDLVK